MKTNKLIAWLTGILTLSLAVFSFILSFNALTDLAAQHNVSIPALFPFLVEFAVVIFSLNALYRSLNGLNATWQWSLIIGSSLLAGTFNVIHAEPDIISRSMAAMPSLFLLLSFETFLSQLKHAVNRQAVLTTLAELSARAGQARAELEQMTQQHDTLTVQIEQARAKLADILNEQKEAKRVTNRANVEEMNAARDAKIAERREHVLSLVDDGVSQKDIADTLDVSVATIRRDIRALNGRANGNGHGGGA